MAKRAPKHFFSKNASVNLPRTRFDMTSTNTTTLSTDYLYPVFCQPVLPGDSWNLSVSNFIRMISPIDVPMMDNLYCDYHFWFVPMRLVWEHTKYFFGEQDRTPETDNDYTIPQITFDSSVEPVEKYVGWQPYAGLPQTGSIYDYFNIPIQGTDGLLSGDISLNALPLRSYNLIFDDWYRDEQRVDYSYYNVGDTADTADKYYLLKRGKRFDLFTSSLLEPQLGQPVDIPLGTFAPVIGNGNGLGLVQSSTSNNFYLAGSQIANYETGTLRAYVPNDHQAKTIGAALGTYSNATNIGEGQKVIGVNTDAEYSGLICDLSNATAATVASLRQAMQMQAYQEIQAKSGQRMVEYIYSQYGVIQPDILTRPEFLGGMHQELTVQPIVQNSSTNEVSPQGNLTGIIYGAHGDHGFTRSFTEFGFIIGIMNIYSDLTYFQGLDRMWSWQTNLDLPIPIFANLTDEALYKKELVLTGTTTDNEVFGYVERYAPYKYAKNTLTGLVRPNAPLSVGQWSLAEMFTQVPENTSDFIQSNTPVARIEAVNYGVDEDGNPINNPHSFIVNQKFSGNVVRVLPAYSDPMKWFMRV